MSAALEGFVTGFASTLADNVIENKKRARDYFDKQVEYARTTGLENRRRVKAEVDNNVSIARQLEAVGVPKEIIMAQVNQDPAGLSAFQAEVEKIRASSNVQLTPEQWKAYISVAGDFKAPDEDLATFVARTYDPIVNAANSPDFADDPKGSFLSSLMGFNAMDQARSRLGETVVADGLTAEQLIQYGDVQPQRVGGTAIVTRNYETLPQSEKERSISEVTQLSNAIDERVEMAVAAAETAGTLSEGSDATPILEDVVVEIISTYPGVSEGEAARLAEIALRKRGLTIGGGAPVEEPPPTEPESLVEAPPSPEMGDGSQPTEMPSEGPPTASVTPDTYTTSDGVTLTLVRDNDDGTSTFMDPDGNEYRIRTELVRQ